MNKSYRIRTDVGTNADKHIKIKLDQEVSQFEILSLKIDQKDAFQFFNCNHGVLVGRVTANDSVGIPNAKVSIFIPISDEDKENSDIFALYPYETPRDKNLDGRRYNLLPRVATERRDGKIKPKQPFGSFPTKQEVVTNDTVLEVYEKYYKYSTVTNQAGDYMLFGVPVGTQTVHMSVDITDIGRFSMTPASMVTILGYSENLFTDDNTKIKESDDLDDLPNIETQEISVDIIPFCGDEENFDIGITRQDFRIRAELLSTFTLFGTSFTDGDNSMWGDENDGGNKRIRELYKLRSNTDINVGIGSRRIGKITEKVYSINANISDADIDAGNFDPDDDVVLLDQSQYVRFIRDGDFVYQIPCNRRKIVTNDQGEDVVVDNDFKGGAFTEFRGFMVFEIPEDELRMDFTGSIGDNADLTPFRYRLKFPQSAERNASFTDVDAATDTQEWKKQNFKFEFNKFYTVATFHGTVANDTESDGTQDPFDGFLDDDGINVGGLKNTFFNTGILATNDAFTTGNAVWEFPTNTSRGGEELFGGNWMNLSIYLQQHAYLTGSGGPSTVKGHRSNTNFTILFRDSDHFYTDNAQTIAANDPNTKHMARSDLHYTDFVEVPFEDIDVLDSQASKGFTESVDIGIGVLSGDYKNGEDDVPFNGGRIDSNPANAVDTEIYFYKGLKGADCLQYLKSLNLT